MVHQREHGKEESYSRRKSWDIPLVKHRFVRHLSLLACDIIDSEME
jgi:hypothetical protein